MPRGWVKAPSRGTKKKQPAYLRPPAWDRAQAAKKAPPKFFAPPTLAPPKKEKKKEKQAPARRPPIAPPRNVSRQRGFSELPIFHFKKSLPGQPSWAWGKSTRVGPGQVRREQKKEQARVAKLDLRYQAKADTEKGLNELFRARHEQELAIARGDLEEYQAKTKKFDKTHKKLSQAGILAAPSKGGLGVLARGVQDVQDAAIYAPYGLYGTARAVGTDEWRMLHGKAPTETPKLAKAIGAATWSDIQHPGRHPGNLALDALAIASFGAGSAARLGAAGTAFKAAARTGEGYTALSRGAKAALTRPSYKGGSLLHRPAPRETELIWRGELDKDRQLEMGGHPRGHANVSIPRLEPDNPLLRPLHRARNKILQKQLDVIASGGKLNPSNYHAAARQLLGLDAPTVVGREARALRRVSPELADTIETQIPQEWIKKVRGEPAGQVAKRFREVTNQFRFFGVYLGPKYVTTNVAGNTLMGVSTQGVTKVAANMWRAHRMKETHGEELLRAVDHDMGLNRTSGYLQEAIRGEEALPHRGGVRGWQDRYTHKVMNITDVNYRRASWQYRAREKGFNTVEEQRDLLTNPKHAKVRAAIARRGRKDAVDFDSLTPGEKQFVEYVFFYPWMSRASVWTARTVANRPIKSAAVTALAQQGKEMSGRELGDQPQWMKGYIKTPWGVINPKSVLAPSTVGDVVQQGKAVGGTFTGQRRGDPRSFFQEFGTPPLEVLSGGVTGPQLLQTTLPASTYVRAGSPLGEILGLHPPKTCPETGLKEALGPGFLCGLAPRPAKGEVDHGQAKRERMLETSPLQHIAMRKADRLEKIPDQVKRLKKYGGVSQGTIAGYKGDLDAIEHRDEFRLKFAQGKGKNSWRQLKNRDKAEAALEFLHKHSHVPTSTIEMYRHTLRGLKSKTDINYYQNQLWSLTGIGQYKSNWDALVKAAGG